MRTLLLLVLVSFGCAANAPTTNANAPIEAQPATTAGCPAAVDGYCSGGTCHWMAKTIPAPSAWCPDSAHATAQLSTCGAYQNLSVYDGDQSIEVYYDASGAAIAMALWESEPPCEGACKLACLGGPPSFVPPDPASCSSTMAVSPCGA